MLCLHDPLVFPSCGTHSASSAVGQSRKTVDKLNRKQSAVALLFVPGVSSALKTKSNGYFWRLDMADKIDRNVGYMLAGLGVGSLMGILFASNSGEETREYFKDTAKEAKEYAEHLIERGKEVVTHKKEQIVTALNAGLEVYCQEQLIGRKRSRNPLESRVGF
jgi:YtxH-like protein